MGKRPRGAEAVAEMKSPEQKKPASGLQDLKVQLANAIKLENFEEAAILRDKIKTQEEEKPMPADSTKTARKKKKDQ
jgi:protein-arginine kinase activator protein McsA